MSKPDRGLNRRMTEIVGLLTLTPLLLATALVSSRDASLSPGASFRNAWIPFFARPFGRGSPDVSLD
jgi:hypothetical protein